MSQAVKFFDGMLGEMTQGIHTCMLGKINKFDSKTMRAEVILLHKRQLSAGQAVEYPLILDAPVAFFHANGFFISPPYKKGDTVVVIFAESDIDKILASGEKENPNSGRRHALEDAIVIGGWQKQGDALPTDGESLVIGHKSNSAHIKITQSGNVYIKAGNVYLGGEGASEGVPLGDSLKAWLDSHKHSTPMGMSGGPEIKSPEPSQVVKVK